MYNTMNRLLHCVAAFNIIFMGGLVRFTNIHVYINVYIHVYKGGLVLCCASGLGVLLAPSDSRVKIEHKAQRVHLRQVEVCKI